MKKQTLLSLMTATAIVGTSAVSFAAWDVTSASKDATLTMANPVSIELADLSFAEGNRALGELPTYTSNVDFKVTTSNLADTLTLSTSVTETTDGDMTDKFTVTFAEESGGTGLTGLVDSTLTQGDNKYTVTLTPKNEEAANAVKGKTLTVKVTGALSKK